MNHQPSHHLIPSIMTTPQKKSKEEYNEVFTPNPNATAADWVGEYKDLFSPDDKNPDSRRFIEVRQKFVINLCCFDD